MMMLRFLALCIMMLFLCKHVHTRCIAGDTNDKSKWPGFVTDLTVSCIKSQNGETYLKVQWKPPVRTLNSTYHHNVTIAGYQIVVSDDMLPFLTCYYTKNNVHEYLIKTRSYSPSYNIDIAVSARPTLVGSSTPMVTFKSC